jgi:membrane protease YdiL (CAAX protease family)
LLGQDRPLRGWAGAAAVGALGGVVSVYAFRFLGVRESDDVQRIYQLFPSLDWRSPAVQLGIGLPSALAAAVSEEVFYRGIIQPWLARRFGNLTVGVVLAIAITTALWTATHSLNTDHIALKLGQIAVLGVLFGLMARRRGVETSMVAHLCLNLLAVLCNAVLPNRP